MALIDRVTLLVQLFKRVNVTRHSLDSAAGGAEADTQRKRSGSTPGIALQLDSTK